MNQRRWIGVILIVLGAFFVLENVGVLDNFWEILGTYWPFLLILAGAYNIATNPAGKTGGIIVALVGALLLINNLDQVEVFTRISFWPLLLILVGLWFLLQGGKDAEVIDKESLNSIAIFSGNSSKIVSQNFKGGSSVSVFGGTEVDLREANISRGREGEVKFDVFAMFGGADIYVPENWQVVVKGIPVFGGLDDKTGDSTQKSENGKEGSTIIINYLAIFGGVDVKN